MSAPAEVKAAARRFAQSFLAKGFRPAGLHCYTARDGAALYWRMRLKHPESGEKGIRPIHLNGSGYVLGEPEFPDGKKPIYRLHEIAAAEPQQPVWWVEGEQKADALARLGLVATTAGGANDDDRRDFEPLRGRHVIVWPDNDDPGRAHAERVAAKLRALGCTVEILEIEPLGLPKGGDVVDYLAAHPNVTAADLMALARLPMSEGAATEMRVELLRADAVTIEPVRWLWDGWLARGKLHVLAGAPGTGKTTIALALAATITTGGRWPDSSRAERGDVLIWSGEDDPTDTLAPRLKAAGADLARVQFVRSVRDHDGARPFDPATDMAALIAAARGLPDLRLLILDPIVNAVGADSHKNVEVRRALAPVVDLAESLRVAAFGISHFSKNTAGRDPVERVTGSLAFGALPRVVLAAAKIKNDDGTDGRLLARAKNNLGPDSGGFAYSIELAEIGGGISASRVLWGAAVEGTARELLADAEAEHEAGGEQRGAADWLRDILTDHGDTDARTLRRLADEAGHAWRTVQRAAGRIGVAITRRGFGHDCRTTWALRLAPNPPLAPLAPDTELGAAGATDAIGVSGEGAEVF